jgi:hypothetical protein
MMVLGEHVATSGLVSGYFDGKAGEGVIGNFEFGNFRKVKSPILG